MAKKKVVNHAVVVVRDGKQVTVEPGTAFAFTAGEIEDVIRHQGVDSVRDPLNEDPDAALDDVDHIPKLTAAQKEAAKQAADKAKAAAKPPKSKGTAPAATAADASGAEVETGGEDETGEDDGDETL